MYLAGIFKSIEYIFFCELDTYNHLVQLITKSEISIIILNFTEKSKLLHLKVTSLVGKSRICAPKIWLWIIPQKFGHERQKKGNKWFSSPWPSTRPKRLTEMIQNVRKTTYLPRYSWIYWNYQKKWLDLTWMAIMFEIVVTPDIPSWRSWPPGQCPTS